MSVRVILNRIKAYAGLETDQELADWLGVPIGRVRGWITRNSIEWKQWLALVEKATTIDLNLVVRGEHGEIVGNCDEIREQLAQLEGRYKQLNDLYWQLIHVMRVDPDPSVNLSHFVKDAPKPPTD